MPHPSFSDVRRALDQDETSIEALVSSFLARIEQDNEALNAFLYVDDEGALHHARYLDSQRARGNDRPLAGLVLAVKDVICVKGRQVTCGSRMLDGFE
ncbi:MAG: amidase family protein, partial [Rhodothermales bacterium]